MSDIDSNDSLDDLSDTDEEKEFEVLNSVSEYLGNFAKKMKKLQNYDSDEEIESASEFYKEENNLKDEKAKINMHWKRQKPEDKFCHSDMCLTEQQETEYTKQNQALDKQNYTEELMSLMDKNTIASNKSLASIENNNDVTDCLVNRDNASLVLSSNHFHSSAENKIVKIFKETKQDEKNSIQSENVLESSIYSNNHETNMLITSVLQPNSELFEKYSPDEKNIMEKCSDMNTQRIGNVDDKTKTEICENFLKNKNLSYRCDKSFTEFKATENPEIRQTCETGMQTSTKQLAKEDIISECSRKLNQHSTSEDECTSYSNEEPVLNTLGDSIKYFRLSSHVSNLESSLEDVRKNKKNVQEHQNYFVQTDKEIRKLSFTYHPDKVRNRGGTEKLLATAQNLQMILNKTRTALNILNSVFVEDIGTYHKFSFYTKLIISTLCNEDEMKYRIYEVICEIGAVLRIKQENIMHEIHNFFIDGRNFIRSYLYQPVDFEKQKMYCDSAMCNLEGCIQGFSRFCIELLEVKEECKRKRNDRNMQCLLEGLEKDNRRDLGILEHLVKIAKISLKGKYQFFNTSEYMDSYFVLPLVYYTNVILMCSAMERKESIWVNVKSHAKDIIPNTGRMIFPDNDLNNCRSDDWKELSHLKNSYYLTEYYTGNVCYKDLVLKIIHEKRNSTEVWHEKEVNKITEKDIKLEFCYCIQQVNEFLEREFKIEIYNEAAMTNISMLDFKKCMSMRKEFHKEQEEFSKGVQQFKKKSEKMFEKFDQALEEISELNKIFKKVLEQRLSEKASNAFPCNK